MSKIALLVITTVFILNTPVLANDEVFRIWAEVLAKAERGDPKFQTEVGEAYTKGRPLVVPEDKIDLELGWKWLRTAAMKGYKPAQKAFAASKLAHYTANRGTDREELIEALMWHCIHQVKLVNEFGGITPVSDQTREMAHEKTRAFWGKHPELKK
jgi:hypothetical protein